MTKKAENPPAFPSRGAMMIYIDGAPEDIKKEIGKINDYNSGLSLRDYFAAKAMQGLAELTIKTNESDESLARKAYGIADEMLKQREL